MKRTAAFCALATVLVACGDGNPFDTAVTDPAAAPSDPGTTPATPTDEVDGFTIPESISSDLSGFTFVPDPNDPNGGTLTVQGVFLDEDLLDSVYRRRPDLDVPGYSAFTAQDDPLDQHSTALVASLNGTRAGVVVTGGQFGTFNGGAAFARDGEFDSPPVSEETGLVSYAGSYAGITNLDGPTDDLLPITDPLPPGTPDSLIPGQAATVSGTVFINVDFADNTVNGTIFNREVNLNPTSTLLSPGETTLSAPDLELDPGVITEDGFFNGNIVAAGDEMRSDIGDYAGIFGGVDSEAVAGAIFVSDHILDGTSAEEEFGIFVLGRCGGPLENSPLCAGVDG